MQIQKMFLTLAYSNKESLELNKKTGNSWFWSRSRNKLWMKGEESGNTQKVKEILVDCDSDAIIYLVEPSGPACHTGEKVCFHNSLENNFNKLVEICLLSWKISFVISKSKIWIISSSKN